jgi:hypothetical protein
MLCHETCLDAAVAGRHVPEEPEGYHNVQPAHDVPHLVMQMHTMCSRGSCSMASLQHMSIACLRALN